MVECVLIPEDEDRFKVVSLAHDFGLLLEHYLLQEGTGLSPDWRVFRGGAKGKTSVVDMRQVPDCFA